MVGLPSLHADLLHWTSLYLAGRLHKPVLPLVAPPPPVLAAAQAANLAAALRTALLLLPPRFSGGELLHAICGLSYSGDVRWARGCLAGHKTAALAVARRGSARREQDSCSAVVCFRRDGLLCPCRPARRMGLAEDSRKVHRIVEGSRAQLEQLYAAPLQAAVEGWGVLQPLHGGGGSSSSSDSSSSSSSSAPGAGGWAEREAWVRDDSPAAQASLLAALPSTVLQRLAAALRLRPQQEQLQQRVGGLVAPPPPAAAQDVAQAWAAGPAAERQRLLRGAVASIVRASSHRQTAAGLLSGGLAKSVRYALSKVRKAWR